LGGIWGEACVKGTKQRPVIVLPDREEGPDAGKVRKEKGQSIKI